VQEETAAQVEKLSPEVVERLLWRPEDTPERLEHSIQEYSTNVLPLLEVKLLHYTSWWFCCGHILSPYLSCLMFICSNC